MGFTSDVWAALLSDEPVEVEEATERISSDAVAAAIVRATLAELDQPSDGGSP
ncbi:MAG: hypothetical protein OXH20_10940 [bacterium]|nr:hypothetical protein [bacterium]MDE0669593.1 hypothetical protein [bacterium]